MLGCEGQQPDISSIGCRGRSNEASLPGHELGRDPSLRASEACGPEVGGARGARAAISCDDGTAAGSAGMLQGPCPVDERHASGPWAYEGKSPPRLPSVLGSRRPALPTAFRREGPRALLHAQRWVAAASRVSSLAPSSRACISPTPEGLDWRGWKPGEEGGPGKEGEIFANVEST